MTFVAGCPFADPEVAARKLMEIANSVEPVQDGRIYIEKINWPFLSEFKGNPAEYVAGLKLAPDPLPYDTLVAFVRSSSGPMPPYSAKILSDDDLSDIYAYLESIPKPPDPKSIPALNP